MTMFVVLMFYTRGMACAGVFSTIEQAKSATEYAAEEEKEGYGAFTDATVIEMELDRVYSGEDTAPMHDYTCQTTIIPLGDLN